MELHEPKTNEDRYLHASQVIDDALAASRSDHLGAIETETDLGHAVTVLGKIVAARKLADEQRKAIVKPHNDEVRTINNRFKELAGPLDGAERALKDAVAAYRRKIEQERREQIAREERNRRERQARENAKAAEEKREPVRHEAPRIEPEPEATMRSGGTAATVRKVWRFEVVDAEALSADHPEFTKPDEVKIREAIKAGTRQISGVRIYEDDQVAVS